MILSILKTAVIGGADGPTVIFVTSNIALTMIIGGIACAILAYLLGSLSFAVIISKVFYKKDIRTFGSGNAGMTNILRTFGKKAAIATLIGDVGKGIVAVLLAKYIFSNILMSDAVYGAYIATIFAVLGHLFPVFFKFKGGKGISVAFGCIIVSEPIVGIIIALVFIIVVFTTKIVSLSSVLAAIAYPISTVIYGYFFVPDRNMLLGVILNTILALLVIFMHRENVKRLLNGTEYKFGQKK